jgi:hypothetical protein
MENKKTISKRPMKGKVSKARQEDEEVEVKKNAISLPPRFEQQQIAQQSNTFPLQQEQPYIFPMQNNKFNKNPQVQFREDVFYANNNSNTNLKNDYMETEEGVTNDVKDYHSQKDMIQKVLQKKVPVESKKKGGIEFNEYFAKKMEEEYFVPTEEPYNQSPIIDNQELVENNTFIFSKIYQTELLAKYLDFTGLESITDFMIYLISKQMKNFEKKHLIKFDKIKLNGCKYLSAWALHYLNQAAGLTVHDLKSSDNDVNKSMCFIY